MIQDSTLNALFGASIATLVVVVHNMYMKKSPSLLGYATCFFIAFAGIKLIELLF